MTRLHVGPGCIIFYFHASIRLYGLVGSYSDNVTFPGKVAG